MDGTAVESAFALLLTKVTKHVPCPALLYKGEMLIKRTISMMTGKGSINHNSRKFHAENTVPERSYLNVEYCCENIKDVYHELFDEAVERYNAKQKRKDRCIDDYYEKIRTGKQEKLFHEVILQVGNKDDCASDSENGDLAAKILDEYMKEFQKRNPTLRVFSAYLHMDEATPHLHIDFIPYITESKRGVDTRVSLKQALGALGFKGGSRGDTELNQWINSEKQQLAMVMERYGIEWEHKGNHEEHLSVLDFKKKERAKEVAELEKKIDEAIKSAEDADKKAERARKELQEIAPLVNNVKAYAGEYGRAVEELLPEAGKLETGKGYREKKAIPFLKKLKEKLYSLYLAYLRLQEKYNRLETDYNKVWDGRERLREQCNALEQRVEKLETVEKDYGRVRKILGSERVDNLVREMKERERVEVELEMERRKLMKRKQREVR